MQPRPVDLAVGGLFVLFYAATRFNTPSTNRSSTTAGRYYLALALYAIAAVGSYLALVQFPHLVSFLVQGDPDQIPATARALSSPLLVALLMTVLLPKLPLLSTADVWLCKRLQEMAAIPGEVRRLSAELRRQRLAVPLEVQAAVRRELVESGFDSRDIQFERDETPMGNWTALSALMAQLGDWDSDRRMLGYLGEWGEVLEKLRARRMALRPKAKTCFRLLRETAEQPETDKGREAAHQYAEDFADQVAQLHHDVIDFISRGVLSAGLTDSARHVRLAAMGFRVTEPRPGFTLNQTMALAGMLAVLLLSGFVFLSAGRSGLTYGVLLVRCIMISAIYTVAVACVVGPKDRWQFARREPGAVRPVAYYVVAAMMAVAITQVIGLVFNALLERGLWGGLQRYRLTYPWMLLTFTASIVTGFLVDDVPAVRWPRLWRAVEGLIGAGALALAAYFTHRWLMDVFQHAIVRPADYRVPPLGRLLLMSSVVGFVIGALVPHWYRAAPRSGVQALHTPLPQPMLPGAQPEPAKAG